MFRKPDLLLISYLALVLSFLFFASSAQSNPKTAPDKGKSVALQFTSPAFVEGASIPAKHTCDGADLSPPLKWGKVPPGTKGLALICDDSDAPVGTWVHWVIYGLPASVTELPEGLPTTETLPSGAKQGINDFRRIGYGGPCPPGGPSHRYFFKLYALDMEINLPPKVTKQALLKAMEGHILAEGQLMGKYKRR
jgi:hypothetical protein